MAVETVRVARHLFNVDEYHRMAEAGILGEDDRVELIEGEIVDMSPIGVRHAHCVDVLTKLFIRLLPEEVLVRVQNPVRLSSRSEVQPDLALLGPRDYSRDNQHPGPMDVLLVVEVSDTTLAQDRLRKLPLYARAGIPEAWIVNLQDDRVEVYSEPSGNEYKQQKVFNQGDTAAVPGFPGVTLDVKRILG